jgi:hypothetical protein
MAYAARISLAILEDPTETYSRMKVLPVCGRSEQSRCSLEQANWPEHVDEGSNLSVGDIK